MPHYTDKSGDEKVFVRWTRVIKFSPKLKEISEAKGFKANRPDDKQSPVTPLLNVLRGRSRLTYRWIPSGILYIGSITMKLTLVIL